MGGTELAALFAVMVIIAVLSVVFLGIYQSKPARDGEEKASTPQEVKEAPAAARRRGAMGQNARVRDRRREAQRAAATQDDSASGTGSENDEEEQEQRLPQSKKERRKQEKQAQREAQQDTRENKNTYEERNREKNEKREAVRRAQEDEIQRAQEERAKKEEEEAAQWMSMIKVEQEGTGEGDDQQEGEGLLSQFIDYIKQRKTVPLEQLATEFKLRTTDVIDRVQGLEAMGHLTGVMDERGKYIYISMEEMEAVAKYINNKGRVAISELAAKSSTFIDLDTKATAVGSLPGLDFDALLADGAST